MTRSFATDGQNDLYLDGGLLAVATGLAAVIQNCEHAAKTLLDEMILLTGQGIPYFEAVWIGVPNIPVFEAALRQRLLAVEDVTGIVSLETARVGDTLTYAATISSVYGEGVLSG